MKKVDLSRWFDSGDLFKMLGKLQTEAEKTDEKFQKLGKQSNLGSFINSLSKIEELIKGIQKNSDTKVSGLGDFLHDMFGVNFQQPTEQLGEFLDKIQYMFNEIQNIDVSLNTKETKNKLAEITLMFNDALKSVGLQSDLKIDTNLDSQVIFDKIIEEFQKLNDIKVNFGSITSSVGDATKVITEDMQRQIDKINDQIDKLEETKNKLANFQRTVYNAKISISQSYGKEKVDDSEVGIKQIKTLLSLHDELYEKIESIDNISKSTNPEDYKTYIQFLENAQRLRKISNYGDDKYSNIKFNDIDGFNDIQLEIDEFIENIRGKTIANAKNIGKAIEQIDSNIGELKSTINDIQNGKMPKLADSEFVSEADKAIKIYNQLVAAIKEYNKVLVSAGKDGGDPRVLGAQDNLYDVIDSLSLSNDHEGVIKDLIADLEYEDKDIEKELAKILNVDIPFNQFIGESDKVVDKLEYIKGLALQLQRTFDAVSGFEVECKIIFNGQEVDIREGLGKEISAKMVAESWLANLNNNLTVDAHSHPNGLSSNYDYVDLKNAIERQYGGITPLSAIVSKDSVTTLDLNGIDQKDALKIYEQVKQAAYKESISVEKLNELFGKEVARKWNPDQFDDLAKYIYDVGEAANQSISPVEKLINIVKYFGKDVDVSKYQDLFDQLDNGMSASDIFNKIAESEKFTMLDESNNKVPLRVDDVAVSPLTDMLVKIREQEEEHQRELLEVNITYEEVLEKVKRIKEAGLRYGAIIDEFGEYFNSKEINEIAGILDIHDMYGAANAISDKFGIDPDEFKYAKGGVGSGEGGTGTGSGDGNVDTTAIVNAISESQNAITSAINTASEENKTAINSATQEIIAKISTKDESDENQNKIALAVNAVSDSLSADIVTARESIGSNIDSSATLIVNSVNDVKKLIKNIQSDLDTYHHKDDVDEKQELVNAIKNNLTEFFKKTTEHNARMVVNEFGEKEIQDQELHASLFTDGTISVGHGEGGTVPWVNSLASLLSNINKQSLLDLHTHPMHKFYSQSASGYDDWENRNFASDAFSGSSGDLAAFLTNKKLGDQMAGMLIGNILTTLDLSKVSESQMRKLKINLSSREQEYIQQYPQYFFEPSKGGIGYKHQNSLSGYYQTHALFEEMQLKALKDSGISENNYRRYDITNDKDLTKLANTLVELAAASQNTITPLDRLKTIINEFGGNTFNEKAQMLFKSFEKGENSAIEVFKDITGRNVTQEVADTLTTIDTANTPSIIEQTLSQIVGILNTIQSSIDNIVVNTKPTISQQFDDINDLLFGLRNGADIDYSKYVPSYVDKNNITAYKADELFNRFEFQRSDFLNKLSNIKDMSSTGFDINISEIQEFITSYLKLLSSISDAKEQIELATRQGIKIDDINGDDKQEVLKDAERLYKNVPDEFLQVLASTKFNTFGPGPDFFEDDNDNDSVNALKTAAEQLSEAAIQIQNAISDINDNNNDLENSLLQQILVTLNGNLEQISNQLTSLFNFDFNAFNANSSNNNSRYNAVNYDVPDADYDTNFIDLTNLNNEYSHHKSFVNAAADAEENKRQASIELESSLRKENETLSSLTSEYIIHDSAVKDATDAKINHRGISLSLNDSLQEELKTMMALNIQYDAYNLKDKTVNDFNSISERHVDVMLDSVDAESKKKQISEELVAQLILERNAFEALGNSINTEHNSALDKAIQLEIDKREASKSLTDQLKLELQTVRNLNQAWAQHSQNQQQNPTDSDGNPPRHVWTSARATNGTLSGLNFPTTYSGENGRDILNEYLNLQNQIKSQFNGADSVSITEWVIDGSKGQLQPIKAVLKYVDEATKSVLKQIIEIKEEAPGVYKWIEDSASVLLKDDNNKPFDTTKKDIAKAQYDNLKAKHKDLNGVNWSQLETALNNINDDDSLKEFNLQLKLTKEHISGLQAQAKNNTFGNMLAEMHKLTSLGQNSPLDASDQQLFYDQYSVVEQGRQSGLLNSAELEQEENKLEQIYNTLIKIVNAKAKVNSEKSEFIPISTLKDEQLALKEMESIAQKHSAQIGQSFVSGSFERKDNTFKWLIADADGAVKQITAKFNEIGEVTFKTPVDKLDLFKNKDSVLSEAFGQGLFDSTEWRNLIGVYKDVEDKLSNGIFNTSDIEQFNEEIKLAEKNLLDVSKTIEKAKGKERVKVNQSTIAKYDFLNADASKTQLSGSALDTFNEYKKKYNELLTLRNKINTLNAQSPDLVSSDDISQFNILNIEVAELAKALDKLRKSAGQDIIDVGTDNISGLTGIDVNDIDSLRQAMETFAHTTQGGKIANVNFDESTKELTFDLQKGQGVVEKMKIELMEYGTQLKRTTVSTEEHANAFERFAKTMSEGWQNVVRYVASFGGFYEAVNQVRVGIGYIREIDSALTELKKVTDASDIAYDNFLDTMSETASVVGSTVANLTTMAAEWARLGYSIQEAGELAETTAVLLNVSEFTDATEASEALISTIQAFGYAANESMHVVDILNEVGNNYAVSSSGLATALKTSASALMSAGNDLEQSVALIAASNKVVQDPSSVGAALRTIALRIRGTSVEVLEEMGEETEGVVESVSKLQDKVKSITGVDILDDNGSYRSTYEILVDLAEVWDEIGEKDPKGQAAVLELLAGKNRANALAAILTNVEDLKDAYQSALEAEGSALRENEAYLESIQGRIDIFTNAVQTAWSNIIDTEVIKGVVDIGTALVETFGNLPGVITAAGVALGAFVKFKTTYDKDSAGGKFFNELLGSLSGLKELGKASKAYTSAQKVMALSLYDTAYAQGKLTAAQYIGKAATLGLKEAFQALWSVLKANPAIFIAAGITAAALALDYFHTTAVEAGEAAKDAFKDMQNVISSTESTVRSLTSELKTVEDAISSLEGKELSFTDSQELERLKQQKALLESSKAAQEDLLEAQKDNNRQQAIAAARAVAKTQGQGAEEQRKTTETVYSIGSAILTAAGLAAIAATGGAATPAVLGAAGFGGAAGWFAGSKVGEVAGDYQTATDGNFISWYETYADALDLAQQKEEDALKKYQKDTSDIDKLEKWQEAQEKTSEIEASMYNHLSEMQTYINALDPTKDKAIIDEYYDMVDAMRVDLWEEGSEGGKDAKYSALDRIFGKNASEEIQKIKEQIENAMESGEEFDFEAAINSSDELQKRLKAIGISVEDVKNFWTQLGGPSENQTSTIINTVETYSALAASVESYNEVLAKTSEIVSDNTEVSQEYKDSLVEIGISQEELSECFDENNGLIVKNASLLNKLVKQKQRDKQATIAEAKAYAQINYLKIAKQIQAVSKQLVTKINATNLNTKATSIFTLATLENAAALREQLEELDNTIQQFALLEMQLSKTGQAYQKYQDAKERDAQLNYDETWLEALKSIDNGILSGAVGTEEFEYAVKLIVPEEVYKAKQELGDIDGMIRSIHDYLDGDPLLANWFTVDKESGELSYTVNNARAFINDLIKSGAAIGTSNDFQFADDINGLSDITNKINEYRKSVGIAYDVTEETVAAMLSGTEDFDATWENIFSDALMNSIDRNATRATRSLAENQLEMIDLVEQYKNGEITLEDYNTKQEKLINKHEELNNTLSNSRESAAEVCNSFMDINEKLDESSAKLEEYQKLMEENKENRNDVGDIIDSRTGKNLSDQYANALEEHAEFLSQKKELEDQHGTMTAFTVGLALEYEGIDLENIEAELEKTKEEIQNAFKTDDVKKFNNEIKSTYGVIAQINDNGDIEYTVTDATTSGQMATLERLDALKADGTVDINALYSGLTPEQQAEVDKLTSLQDKQNLINYYLTMDGTDTTENALDRLVSVIEDIHALMSQSPVFNCDTSGASSQLGGLLSQVSSWVGTHTANFVANVSSAVSSVGSAIGGLFRASGNADFSGQSHAAGTANNKGKIGLPRAEKNSLVGEFGPELVCANGRYYTVGDHGAEFVDLPKDAIIFNHIQTRQLLSHGYTNSRGKGQGNLSFASGNAHVTGNAHYGIVSYQPSDKNTSFKDGVEMMDWDDITSGISDTVEDTAEQIVDFIEIKLEKIENMIAKTTARIENLVDDTSQAMQKREQYDKLIAQEKQKASVNSSAASYYSSMAESLLNDIPSSYRDMAKNGAIAVEEFVGEGQTKIAEAIEKYREYSNKADEAEIAALEAIAEVSALRLQAIEDIADDFDNLINLISSKSSLLQASMDLVEETGERLSKEYYSTLIGDTNATIEQLEQKKEGLLSDLNAAVKNGEIKAGSDDWYTAVNLIMECNEEIINCKQSIEEWNNAILDLKWDNLEKFIAELENVESQLSHLLGILSKDEKVVDEMGEWTDEGITSLGLLAQQMELAQYKAQQYSEAITDLEKDYHNGLYSTDEYNEKLAELTENQWDSIEAYEQAKDELVALNKVRVNAVKDGMQKEIDAYKELIDAKKESLNQDKDAHDFEKDLSEKNKKIANIQRQLAAIANNDSAEAAAKRKQLQAELVAANTDLDEYYYDHSVTIQQNALDKEYENFQNSKNKEMELLDKWLEDQEAVIAESLEFVKQNTDVVLSTINSLAHEYGIQVSEAITLPWTQGQNALSDYSGVFNSTIGNLNSSVDAFVGKLNEIKHAQSEVIQSAQEMANSVIDSINKAYDAATQSKNWTGASWGGGSGGSYSGGSGSGGGSSYGSGGSSSSSNGSGGNLTGQTINASGAKIYDYIGASPETQYFKNDPTYTVLQEKDGWVQVRHSDLSSGVTGWFKKSDITGYAKGTSGTPKDAWALIDELGEELVLNAGPDGRLQYLTKGTSVIPANITERLMEWGELDPSETLQRSAPVMSAPHLVNNNFNINLDFGSLVHIDNCSESAIPDVQKLVKQEVNNMVKGLNQSIKRYTR